MAGGRKGDRGQRSVLRCFGGAVFECQLSGARVRFFGGSVFGYGLSYGSGTEEGLGCSDENSNLTYPKEKHPFDDLGLDIRTVLLGHEALGEILFLLAEGKLQALCDGACLRWLNLRRL